MTLYFLHFPHACAGYESVFPVALSVGIFILLFVSFIIVKFLKAHNSGKINLIAPVGIIVALLALNWLLSVFLKENVKGNKILEAFTSKCKCGDLSTLTLFDNGYYEVKMAETEFVCRYNGLYSLRGDTLFLDKKILAETDSTYYPVYLVNTVDSLLYPLNDGIKIPVEGGQLTLAKFRLKPAGEAKITALQ